MQYYFDFDFIKHLHSDISDEDVYDEFFRYFLRELHGQNVYVILPEGLSSEEERDNLVLRKLNDAGAKLISEDELLEAISNDSPTPFKFFFINQHSPEQIRNDYGYFAVNSKTFEHVWKVASGFRESKTQTFGTEITSWKDLKDLSFPINFIVFCDRYFFCGENAPVDNLYPLLSTLKLKALTKRTIDILIIGEDFHPKDNYRSAHLRETFDFLTDFFDASLGKQKYRLTIIRVDGGTTIKATEFHARMLVTNNVCLQAGKGFDQFKGKTVREKETLTSRLFVRPKTYKSLLPFFFNFRKAFEKVHDVPMDAFTGLRCLTKNDKSHCLISSLP